MGENGAVRRLAGVAVRSMAYLNRDIAGTRAEDHPLGYRLHYGEPRPIFDASFQDELFVIDARAADATAPVPLPPNMSEAPVVSIFTPRLGAVEAAYGRAGYVPEGVEHLLWLDLAGTPRPEPERSIRRVTTTEQRAALLATPERPNFRPSHFDDPRVVISAAEQDGQPVSMGRANLLGTSCYVSAVYTRPRWRGAGLASKVMRALLAEARAAGAREAVLFATAAGFNLYRRLGFTVVSPIGMYLAANLLPADGELD